MNKILSIISTTALCIGFAACDDVPESLSKPQTNPQEPMFEASNLVVTPTTEQLDLENLYDGGQLAKVATYSINALPENYHVGLEMQISASETFANAATLPVKIDAETGIGYVNAYDLDQAYFKTVSKASGAANVNVRFIGEVINGTEVVRLGGTDTYFGKGQLSIKPFTVAPTYKLGGSATANFQVPAEGIEANPVFTVIVEVSSAQAAEGFSWYVEAPDGRRFGPASATDQIGELELWNNGAEYKGLIKEMGPYQIKVNMRARTYEWGLAIQQLYTPGVTNGWNQAASQVLTTTNYQKYTGFAHLNGQFKFSSQPNWDGINYGDSGTPGVLSTAGDAGNLNAPADALYQCTVDLPTLTYKLTQINLVGAIGSMNSWGSDEAFAPSADFLTWTATIKFSAGDEWKIRFNGDWGLNLGGEYTNLTQDGSNLRVAEKGTYLVTLNLTSVPYTITMVKQ